MTENRKKIFTDCQAELIRLESQSVIVTSAPFEGEKDDLSNGNGNSIISDTLKL